VKKILLIAAALSVTSWALPSVGKVLIVSYAQEEPSPDEKPAPKPEKPKPAPKPEPKPESPEIY
jgi:hypothetical protein